MDKSTELWEIEQIKQLKARYFRFVDTKQWTDLRQVFTDDLEFTYGDEKTGIRAKTADDFMVVAKKSLTTAVSTHHGHMPEIQLTGPNTAKGIWAMFDYVDNAENNRAFHGYGHYHEEYLKGADGQWRIRKVYLTRLRIDIREPTPLSQIARDSPRGK